MGIANDIARFKKELRELSKSELVRMYTGAYMKIVQLNMQIEEMQKERVEINKLMESMGNVAEIESKLDEAAPKQENL